MTIGNLSFFWRFIIAASTSLGAYSISNAATQLEVHEEGADMQVGYTFYSMVTYQVREKLIQRFPVLKVPIVALWQLANRQSYG